MLLRWKLYLLRCMQRRVRRELHCLSLRCKEGTAAQVIGRKEKLRICFGCQEKREEQNLKPAQPAGFLHMGEAPGGI